MTLFTILAALFLVGLVLWIFYGYGLVVTSPGSGAQKPLETCGLCRKKFDKSEMVERTVGDSKLLYFCQTCVKELNRELTLKHQRN